ncbi:DUF3006 domain-containing protein [Stigmatella aurantiaca]|uniref:Conserved uncharacterized protein n=1 Tax=Stigmatella aurantiaca (strain DW4/3-1) TaxID=378806 RepID=E3FKZ9_STIAD|nr:DUF3006 domain-containing protein [Stigmatella aurantiaca]ADO70517.1 conserved uncharacterized protein [Stigmatella aurantiaca DW4/3-1]
MAAMVGSGDAGRCSGQAWQVEVVEDTRVQVVELDTGRARTVDRSTLPREAREGDVVVDGRLDPELRARMAQEVAEVRARRAVPVPRGLDLEGSPAPPLTARKEQ